MIKKLDKVKVNANEELLKKLYEAFGENNVKVTD